LYELKLKKTLEDYKKKTKLKKHKTKTLLVAKSPGKYICRDDKIAQNAKKAAAKVTNNITFLLSNMSDNFPIGHCDIAPDIASKNVTNEI
jgi:hypothetical protein